MAISDAINTPPVASLSAEIAAASAPLFSADGYLAANSQYVYRGVALRSDPSITAALSLSTRQGWFIDAWGGRVDAANYYYGYEIASEWLVDLSVGYSAAINADWQWSLSRAWINGFDNNLPKSQNYQEWRGNLFYRETVAMQFAYTDDYRQLGWSAWNAEISIVQPLLSMLNGEIGAGHAHGAGGADNSYNYGWLGAQGVLLKTEWNLRWYYSGSGAERVLGPDRADSRVELSLTWHLPFSR